MPMIAIELVGDAKKGDHTAYDCDRLVGDAKCPMYNPLPALRKLESPKCLFLRQLIPASYGVSQLAYSNAGLDF
jgi:hypothetical protein